MSMSCIVQPMLLEDDTERPVAARADRCLLLLTLEQASDQRVRVRCHGEIDMSTAGQLDDEVRRAAAGGARVITVDLSGVGFIDCSGLRVLLGLDGLARDEGWRLELASTPAVVERLFELTRTSGRFARTG
jgi:anti-anti-sigma factor